LITSSSDLLKVCLQHQLVGGDTVRQNDYNTHFNSQLPGQLGKMVSECQIIVDYATARGDGSGCGDKWNSMTCKATINLPLPSKYHSIFFTRHIPNQPRVSKH